MSDRIHSPDELARQAYTAAIRLLASRDHCIAELVRKLDQRGHDSQAVQTAIVDLQQAGYVDEQRYADEFASQRIRRGHGALAIRSRLLERGVAEPLINNALEALDQDWCAHAQSVIEKRFDEQEILSSDRKCESRIARFLQSRGFTGGDSLRALHALRKELVFRKTTL